MANRGRASVMFTTSDVAPLLHVHINTVRRWTSQGILNAYHIGPRGDSRFQKEDLTRFLIEQSRK